MGICWGSSADNPTPTTTGCLSSVISQTTSNTASTSISRGSRFSASSGDEVFPNGQILPAPDLRIFSFAELKSATKNFRPEMVLGEGGFGKVFKGWLDEKSPGKSGSGTLIAVKKLNSESLQGFEEWQVNSSFLCFTITLLFVEHSLKTDRYILMLVIENDTISPIGFWV
ncbi:hypothetical protein V6Z11_D02G226600 [Gossypium hirsutum]